MTSKALVFLQPCGPMEGLCAEGLWQSMRQASSTMRRTSFEQYFISTFLRSLKGPPSNCHFDSHVVLLALWHFAQESKAPRCHNLFSFVTLLSTNSLHSTSDPPTNPDPSASSDCLGRVWHVFQCSGVNHSILTYIDAG